MSTNNTGAIPMTSLLPDSYLQGMGEVEMRKEPETPDYSERQSASKRDLLSTKSSLQLDEESLQKLMAILHQNVRHPCSHC